MENSTEVTIISAPEGNVTLDPAIVKDDTKRSEVILMIARAVIVKDTPSYVACGEALKQDKAELKDLEAKLKAKIAPFNEIVKVFREYFASPIDNVKKSINIRSEVMTAYDTKQKEIVAKENARLQDLARKESEKLQAKAEAEAKKGNEAKAEELRQQSLMKAALAPVAHIEKVKIAGITERTNYYAECTDLKALVEYALKSDNLHLIMANDKELGAVARASKGTRTIPGVRFRSETGKAGSRI